MSRERSCRCLLCGMERHLHAKFSAPGGQDEYRRLARSTSALSAFPDFSDLIDHLHGNPLTGSPAKDQILIELLQALSRGNAAAQELLLLAFVPVLHSIARHVVVRHPALSPDDIAQHSATAFLELCASPEFLCFHSHVAYSMARLLRRNAFVWAERESRGWMLRPVEQDSSDEIVQEDALEPIERNAFLRHFLLRCRQRGVISGEDFELLAQFKLDGSPGGEYSNASRQRMKRLVGKLRRAANGRRKPHDERQLRLF